MELVGRRLRQRWDTWLSSSVSAAHSVSMKRVCDRLPTRACNMTQTLRVQNASAAHTLAAAPGSKIHDSPVEFNHIPCLTLGYLCTRLQREKPCEAVISCRGPSVRSASTTKSIGYAVRSCHGKPGHCRWNAAHADVTP